MATDSQPVTLMGTLDEQYLAPRAFNTMYNLATLKVNGGDFFTDEGDVDIERIRAHVGRVARGFPSLRQRPVSTLFRITTPAWLETSALNLEHHVRLYPELPSDRLALARACTGEGLPPLKPRLPLWDIHCGQLGPYEAVLMVRIQHAMGDGYVLAQLLHALMSPPTEEMQDDEPTALRPSGVMVLYRAAAQWLREYPPPGKAWREYWRKPFRRRIRRWLRRLRYSIGSVETTGPSQTFFPDYARFDLAHAKSLAKSLGCSLNALVVAAALVAAGAAHPHLSQITFLVPFSRRRPKSARNHVSAVTVSWQRGDTLEQTVLSITRAMDSAFRGATGPLSAFSGYATYLMFSRRPLRYGSTDLTGVTGWPTVAPPASIGCLATGYGDDLVVALRTSSPETTETMMGCLRSILSTTSAPKLTASTG